MNLKEFRAAYPQYNDLDDYTLTTKLHKKFYADMDFGEFAKRVEYGPFDPGAGLAHEEQRLKGVGGQPQGFIERNIAPAVDVAKSVGGQIRTGLEQVGTPYIPGMLTEAESARPPMPLPLQPAHEPPPVPYPETLQPAHQPPPGPLELEAGEQAEDLPDTGGGLGLPGVLAPLAVAGPAWLASKVGKYTQYLPERGIGEDVDLEGILSGQVPLDPRSLAQREAQGKEIEEAIMGITSLFATEPQEQKVLETVAKPFEYLDTMLSKGVEPLPGGLREPVKDFAELLILIKGPKVAVGTINKIKNSNAFRMATVKERGLMVQDLAETLKKNPNISEGELVRRSQQYKREAEQPRAEGEITAEEFLAERERVVGKKPETVTASEAYIRKNNLPEAKRKLEVLKQRYAENGIESEIPKVEKAIAAIDEVMTEAPAHAAPEPDQVTPFPDQGPGQPTPEPKRQPTPDELRAKGKEIDAELEADLDKVEVPPVDEVAIEPEVKPEKDTVAGEGETPLPPKEQKKWLLEEVDQAIKEAYSASDIEKANEYSLSGKKIRGTYKDVLESPDTITFHVPGDGEFTITNSKDALEEFKKRANKFPAGPLRRKKLKSLQQMSVKAQRDLYEGYAGKTVKQQVEVEGKVITIEKPAGKRLSEIDEDLSAHKQLLDCIKALKK